MRRVSAFLLQLLVLALVVVGGGGDCRVLLADGHAAEGDMTALAAHAGHEGHAQHTGHAPAPDAPTPAHDAPAHGLPGAPDCALMTICAPAIAPAARPAAAVLEPAPVAGAPRVTVAALRSVARAVEPPPPRA